MRRALSPVVAIARKDLRLLARNRGALFFAAGWPILMAIFFGLVFGGRGERGRIPVVAVDEDGTPESRSLVARLGTSTALELTGGSREEAEGLVRRGKKAAAVVVPAGYGAAAAGLFRGEARRIEILEDPSREPEAAMLAGIATGAAMEELATLFSDPARATEAVDRARADLAARPPSERRRLTERYLGELRTYLDDLRPLAGGTGRAAGGFRPVSVERRALRVGRERPRSAFDFTFPQGILWGVIGSALGFALSLVTERTRGTLTRLEMSPLSRAHVLAGKALACAVTILAVEAGLLCVGALFFGVRPTSWALTLAAALSVAACFVGVMMLVAVLGRSEQSAGGLAWSIMMPLAMVGGAMVPLFAMPSWMQILGNLSPVKWGILALEGATWRGFSPSEMALPCAVLVAVGLAGFALGVGLFRDGARA